MKHRNNFTYKMNYLENLLESQWVLTGQELEKIYPMAEEGNPVIRQKLVQVLAGQDFPETEELLRKMTWDKNRFVKRKAVESLGLGSEKKTLQRLKEMMRETNSALTRCCAISSYFSVWVNLYGYDRESMKNYLEDVEPLYRSEKSIFPLNVYEYNRYQAGKEEALEWLYKVATGGITDNFREQYGALSRLFNLRNIRYKKQIDVVLEKVCASASNEYGLQWVVGKLKQEAVWPMVLLLDRGNAGLSQILQYLAWESPKYEMLLCAYGTWPKQEIDEKLVKLFWQRNYDIKCYQRPEKVKGLERYDFIVPVGQKLETEKYPFQKIIPIFENVDEKMLDFSQAEEMLEELRDYIYAEMNHEG